MDSSSALRALPILAAVALTPLLIRLWGWLSPPRECAGVDLHELRAKNGWINILFTLLMIGSFGLPFLLFGTRLNNIGLPAIGLAFGGAVVIPWIFVCVITLPFGFARYHEFWLYYEQRYRIGLMGIVVVYVPLALVGAASIIELVRRGIW
jgi:hypothetical protein